MTTGLFSHNND